MFTSSCYNYTVGHIFLWRVNMNMNMNLFNHNNNSAADYVQLNSCGC